MTREETVFQEFGSELKGARERQRRSIDEVAAQTKIHRRYIEAIEQGSMGSLPQGPYIRAFLREYARAVGLVVPTEFSSSNPPPAATKPGVTGSSLNAKKVTMDTARLANQVAKTAAKTAARTTEQVIKKVESAAEGAVDVLTSKSLWAEAEQVRRERLGISPQTPREPTPPQPKELIPSEPITQPTRSEEKPPENPFHVFISNQPEPPSRKRKLAAVLPIGGGWLGSRTNQVILACVVIFGLVAYFAIRQNRKQHSSELLEHQVSQEELELPKTEPRISKAPNDTGSVAASAYTAPLSQPPKNDSLHFTLKAHDAVWVSVGADSLIGFRGELKAGETKSFSASKKFVVNLGNQKAVDMQFNGQPLSHLPTIENSGVVVRNLVLTKDRVSIDGKQVSPTAVASNTKSNSSPVKPVDQKLQNLAHVVANGSHSATITPGRNTSTPQSNTQHKVIPTTTKPQNTIHNSGSSTATKIPAQKTASAKKLKKIEPISPVPARP